MKLSLIGPAYTSSSPLADNEALMNMYLEDVMSPNAPDKVVAYPIPGLTLWTTLLDSPLRGLFTQNGKLFAVGGGTPYELLEDKTANALGGPMNVDSNPCTFASSGPVSNQLLISSGNHVYCYNLASFVFADVLTGGVFVIYLNDYFLSLDVANNQFFVSAFNDGTTWPGGQAQSRSVSGDKWRAMIADGQYAWLFGGQKTDVYQLAGSGNTIFVPVQGVSINEGIAAPFSACLVNNAPQWVSENEHGLGVVLRAENFSAVRRSTFAVEGAIQGYSRVQDAVAFSHQIEGHQFWLCNFPTARATWGDDAARSPNDSWHMRGFWDSPNMRYQAYRPQFHAYCFGKHLVGDRESGNIYEIDVTTCVDIDGSGIRRLRQTAPLRDELNRVFYGQMRLNVGVGLGTQSGQGANPQIMAQWSGDGGLTFGNEHWVGSGKIGRYNTLVEWPRVGALRQAVFRFVMTDPVRVPFISGYVDAEVGLN